MVVSILGCGWYGKALAERLLKNKAIVKGSATSPEKRDALDDLGILPYLVKFDKAVNAVDPVFFDCDVLVVSIPPKTKSGEGESYLLKIQHVIAACIQYQVKKVIYISSTGVYGDYNSEVDELTAPNPDTPSGLKLFDAEQLFKKETSLQTTIVRFGGLIGPDRHPGRFFAGKTGIPNGLAPVNLIHQLDCVGITMAIIDKDAFGYVFNACSPDHPPKHVYYSEMAAKAGLPAPVFIPELNSWKIVNSIQLKNVLGYEFKVDNLNAPGVF